MKNKMSKFLYAKFKYFLLFVFAFLMLIPINVYAFNTEFEEDPAKWFDHNNAQTVQTSIAGTYDGYLRFFYLHNSFYCHISYSESGMSGNDYVFLSVTVSNPNREYEIMLSADSDDSNLPCAVSKSFGETSVYGQDIYFAIEFNQKEDKNVTNCIDVAITINDSNYSIVQGLVQPGEDASDQKGDPIDTTSPTEKRITRTPSESSTKYIYSGSMDKTQATTKFAGGDMKYELESSATEEETSLRTNGTINSVDEEKTTSMSPAARGLLVLAGTFAVCGTGFLIKYAVNSKQESQAEESSVDRTEKTDEYEDTDDFDE